MTLVSTYTDFLFSDVSADSLIDSQKVEKPVSIKEQLICALPSLLTIPLLSSQLVGGPLVTMSCIPLIIPMPSSSLFETSESIALTEEAKTYSKGLLFFSSLEASLAVGDLFVGDMTRTVIRGMFAGLGWYVTRPEGLTTLSSYTSASFLSGCINGLAALQLMAAVRGPMFSGALPLVINYVRFSDCVFPVLCLGGAYCAWMLLKELTRASDMIGGDHQSSQGDRTNTITGSAVTRRGTRVSASSDFRPFTGPAHRLDGGIQASAA